VGSHRAKGTASPWPDQMIVELLAWHQQRNGVHRKRPEARANPWSGSGPEKKRHRESENR
jgi:hypothetical protein